MSRVQCIDCGGPVVVDPSGLCPDGHLVGADGARIEAAIGVAVPYPDEPEPWVATVKVDIAATTDGAGQPAGRAPRPPSAPDNTARPSVPGVFNGSNASASNGHAGGSEDADDLLRELHSLSDDLASSSPPHVRVPPRSSTPPQRAAAPSPTPPAPAQPAQAPPTQAQAALFAQPAQTPPAPTPQSSPGTTPQTPPAAASQTPQVTASPSSEPAPPSGPIHSDGLAELRALEAAVHQLTGSSADPITDPPSPAPTDDANAAADGVITHLPDPDHRGGRSADREQLAEVEELFARRPRPLTEDLPSQRPSQTGPRPEAPPRPAFERTPWSSMPVEEPEEAPAAAPPAGRATFTSTSGRSRRSEAPSGSDDPIDLGNFTAKGRRVGRAEAKRRRKER